MNRDSARRREIERLRGLIAEVPAQDAPSPDAACIRPQAAPAVEAAADRPGGGTRGGSSPGRLPPQTAGGAYRRIVELCGHHDFCREGLRARLRREGVPEAAIEGGIAEAVRIGLVDDLRWGEMRASAMMRRGMGDDAIVRELRKNGIDPERVDGWPAEFEQRFGTQLERALMVLRKNPPKSKNPRASAYGKLLRKGYAPSIAHRACEAWLDEAGRGL